MSYTVEDINGCTKKLVFSFENVDLSKQIDMALKEKQKSANLKGFRKGKAPISVVQQIYGAQVENDALYRFVSEEFYKAVQEEDLRAVGFPTFGNTEYNDGKDVKFEATVEIFPSFEVADFTKYSFTKEDDKVTDEDVENIKKSYLASKAEMTEITDESVALENGHFSVINFEGETADGEKPENMKANDFLLEIGSNQFIPGFEEALIGMKRSEKKTIELTFPEDYHEETLKGAQVKFHVELLEIKEKSFPEFTDELAKEFGFESVEDFNTKNKSRMEISKKREVEQNLHQQILEKLVEDNKFDIPGALVQQQRKAVQDDLASNLKSQGFDDNMVNTYFDKWSVEVDAKAEFQVRSGLILDSLAKKYEVEANDDDLDKKIAEMAEQSGMEAEQLDSYYKGNEKLKANIMYAIREEKTFEKMKSEMKIS